jgi:tetratricopeptide (TPR) repeat protein
MVGAIAIALTTLVAYVPALRGDFLWDDTEYIPNNPVVRSADGLWQIWTDPTATPQYYPLVFTGFWAEYRLWGAAPLGYHLVNVIGHSLNASLLWRLLAQMEVPGAFGAAMIFALHPVHVGSVAWIAEQKNVISGLFCLLTLWMWLRLTRKRSRWSYLWALTFFACALLSKVTVCAFPVCLLLITWWLRDRCSWREWAQIAPFLILSIGPGMVSLWRERLTHTSGDFAAMRLSLIERTLVAARAVWFYAWKLFWPVDLTAIYPQWTVDPRLPQSYGFLLATIGLVLVLWWARSRLGKAPLVAVLYFIVMLSPSLGFVNVGFMRFSFVADHFQYLASIGLIALSVSLLSEIFKGLRRPLWMPRDAVSIGLALLLGVLTWERAAVYQSARTFWRDNVTKNPQSFLGQYNVGTDLLLAGYPAEAVPHFAVAERLQPSFLPSRINWAMALLAQGNTDAAIEQLTAAAHTNLEWSAFAREKLAEVLSTHGRLADAEREYTALLIASPQRADLHDKLANILYAEGKLDDAVREYREVVRLNPSDADARADLGGVLVAQGNFDEAVQEFAQALRLQPRSAKAHNNWGVALETQGRTEEAAEHFRAALQIDPGNQFARRNLQRIEAARHAATPAD